MSAVVRTKLICGNWKLHKTIAESIELATAIKNAVGPIRDVEVAVAPVFTALHAVAKRLEGSAVALAAQNCFWEDQGAWTGEVSAQAAQGRRLQVRHHRATRSGGSTSASSTRSANLKVQCGAEATGSSRSCASARRSPSATRARPSHVVARQLAGGLAELTADDGKRLVIAYEPVWAIGTGRTATPQQAQEMHEFIRGKLAEQFGDIASAIRIQYGGSVKPDNAALLMDQADIDGALVGGASLKADDFLKIVKYRNS